MKIALKLFKKVLSKASIFIIRNSIFDINFLTVILCLLYFFFQMALLTSKETISGMSHKIATLSERCKKVKREKKGEF